jgi:hypothetical protein
MADSIHDCYGVETDERSFLNSILQSFMKTCEDPGSMIISIMSQNLLLQGDFLMEPVVQNVGANEPNREKHRKRSLIVLRTIPETYILRLSLIRLMTSFCDSHSWVGCLLHATRLDLRLSVQYVQHERRLFFPYINRHSNRILYQQ